MELVWWGWFAITFLGSLIMTRVVISAAKRGALVDEPGEERKIHTKPIPTIGGAAIFIAFSLTLILILASSKTLTSGLINFSHYFGFVLGGLILMIGGLLDDRFKLPAKITVWFPVVAALTVIGFGIEIDKLTNPFGGVIELVSWQSDLLVFVWLLGVMYTTKLLDGLDGLSAGISAIGALMVMFLSLSAAYYQPDVALLAFIIIGALLGFLLWNFHPAQIFLGEGGSTFVGYLLGVLAVISGGKLATALLVIGIPVLDVVWVIVRRFRSGGVKQIFKGDRLHLHHRLYDRGWGQRRVVVFYYSVAAIFGLTTLFLQSYQKIIALVAIVLLMFAIAWFLSSKEKRVV